MWAAGPDLITARYGISVADRSALEVVESEWFLAFPLLHIYTIIIRLTCLFNVTVCISRNTDGKKTE